MVFPVPTPKPPRPGLQPTASPTRRTLEARLIPLIWRLAGPDVSSPKNMISLYN